MMRLPFYRARHFDEFSFFWPCFSCLVLLVKLTKFPGLGELLGLLCSLGSHITESFRSYKAKRIKMLVLDFDIMNVRGTCKN